MLSLAIASESNLKTSTHGDAIYSSDNRLCIIESGSNSPKTRRGLPLHISTRRLIFKIISSAERFITSSAELVIKRSALEMILNIRRLVEI